LGITQHDQQNPEQELFLITLCKILKPPILAWNKLLHVNTKILVS
jgi:hypothetical protein